MEGVDEPGEGVGGPAAGSHQQMASPDQPVQVQALNLCSPRSLPDLDMEPPGGGGGDAGRQPGSEHAASPLFTSVGGPPLPLRASLISGGPAAGTHPVIMHHQQFGGCGQGQEAGIWGPYEAVKGGRGGRGTGAGGGGGRGGEGEGGRRGEGGRGREASGVRGASGGRVTFKGEGTGRISACGVALALTRWPCYCCCCCCGRLVALTLRLTGCVACLPQQRMRWRPCKSS